MILTPIAPVGATQASTLRFVAPDELVYRITPGSDWMVIQFVGPTWTGGAVATIELSLNGVDWNAPAAGAATHSALGFHASITVTGIGFAKIRISTQAAGTDTIRPIVSVGPNS